MMRIINELIAGRDGKLLLENFSVKIFLRRECLNQSSERRRIARVLAFT
jgi:hypothetical protein